MSNYTKGQKLTFKTWRRGSLKGVVDTVLPDGVVFKVTGRSSKLYPAGHRIVVKNAIFLSER